LGALSNRAKTEHEISVMYLAQRSNPSLTAMTAKYSSGCRARTRMRAPSKIILAGWHRNRCPRSSEIIRVLLFHRERIHSVATCTTASIPFTPTSSIGLRTAAPSSGSNRRVQPQQARQTRRQSAEAEIWIVKPSLALQKIGPGDGEGDLRRDPTTDRSGPGVFVRFAHCCQRAIN